MITETRKAIIELIEPYMNKTLAFGCVIDWNHFWNNKWFYIKWNEYLWEYEWITTIWDNWKRIFVDKIIWHYDITAVFDYINSINLWWVWPYYLDRVAFSKEYYILTSTWDNDFAKIPRKPLYLYTEQEEKELLDLLIKIINYDK
jgi:hypothetical protein